CGAPQDDGETLRPVPAPVLPPLSTAEYDFAADPRFSFDERAYLLTIDMDPVAGPGSNLELITDPFTGAWGADILVRRGYSACDGAAAGLSASENIDKFVEFGGLTPDEAQLVLNAAVTSLCPEYIDSGT
ncbi:MAG: DUF732 domain-containing protein, partial [Actinobacteria bacterium]|nr:DUF732 domain-containing protein [Actinomycetota bacterium]